MSLTEQELIMKCNIYFEILGTQSNNQITKDNAAEQLNDPIEGEDIESFIKNSLRVCLLQLGEIASIKQNLEIKSLKQLMEKNSSVIESLKLDNPINVEECDSNDIEQCKQKLQGYKEQLGKIVQEAKSTKDDKEAQITNLQNENKAINTVSEELKAIKIESLPENIEFTIDNLPQEDVEKINLIRDTLKQIKDRKAKQKSSQEEINEQEKLLKEKEKQAAQLQKQATDYRVQTAKAMDEAEKLNDDPEEQAIKDELSTELEEAENITKKSDDSDGGIQRQLTGTGDVDVEGISKAFDETAEKVEGDGLVDTDAAMQEQLGKEKKDTPVVESDIKGVEDVGSFKEEQKSLQDAEMEALSKAENSDEGSDNEVSVLTETTSEQETGENVNKEKKGGRNKKSRKNRKSSKKKSKKNRR
jgi:hypothetical protein